MSLTAGVGWPTIVALIVMYFTSFAVGQEAVQRFYAARDGKAARRGALIAALFYVAYAFIPALIGIVAYSMVQSGTLDATLIEQNGARYVLPTIATQVLPTPMVGLLFAALISATMSSADSDMLAGGSIFANDIYRIYLRPDATDAQVLRVTRWTMAAIGLLSLVVALLDWKDMITVLMFSFALRAGGEFIPYLVGHYWRRASAVASLASIFVGCAVVIYVELAHPNWFEGADAIAGVAANAVVFVVLTHFFPRRDRAVS